MSSEENISNIVLDLLQDHGSINLPGIGCLRIKQIEQYLGSGKGLLMPPTSRILITPADPEAVDFMDLIDRQSMLNKKTKKRLRRQLQRKINEVLNYGETTFFSLGSLSKSENGQMVLDSHPEIINDDSFLLPIVEIETLPQPAEIAVSETAQDSSAANKSTSVKGDEWPSWKAYILPVFAIIIISIILIFTLKKALGSQKVLSNIETREVPKSMLASMKADTSVALNDLFSSPVLSKYGNEDLREPERTSLCVIVVGSYKRYDNVQMISDRLINLGYEIYVGEGVSKRVGIVTPCDATYARPALEEIRRSIEPKAWLLNLE